MWSDVLASIKAAWPVERWKDLGVVVGCSGGADSVALLRAISELRAAAADPNGFVIAAHYNHGLRGDASDGDQQSVARLAYEMSTAFVCERAADVTAQSEAAMRSLRRQFFVRVARESGARYVATAHTADDNVETVLHHLLRGTGPRGMSGIPVAAPINDNDDARDLVLVRPMLRVRRADVRDALLGLGQPWREDESNRDTRYRRNWIRKVLIPMIQGEYPTCVEAIGRTAELQRESQASIDRLASVWLDEHWLRREPTVLACDTQAERTIVIASLHHLWDAMQWPRREMTMSQWQKVAATVQSNDPGRYDLPGKIEVYSDAKQVTFTLTG